MGVKNSGPYGFWKGHGYQNVIAFARFVPTAVNGAQVLTDAFGVLSVSRTAAGLYTVQLTERPAQGCTVLFQVQTTDVLFHEAKVLSVANAGVDGTVTLSHRSVAYASIASGPSASDTGDFWNVVVFEEK